MAVTFGLDIDTNTYGICQNIERENTAESATYQGADGDTEGYQPYDEQETISLTYITDGTAGPTAGGTMTIGGKKYLVETVKETQSNTDYERFEITGRRWVTNTVPA